MWADRCKEDARNLQFGHNSKIAKVRCNQLKDFKQRQLWKSLLQYQLVIGGQKQFQNEILHKEVEFYLHPSKIQTPRNGSIVRNLLIYHFSFKPCTYNTTRATELLMNMDGCHLTPSEVLALAELLPEK